MRSGSSRIVRWLSLLRHIRGVSRLARASILMSRGEDGRAIPFLEAAVLPDGPKQVAMVMLGICHSRLGDKDRAILAYGEAIEAERTWGERSNPDTSAYIVGYAEFFRSVDLRSKHGGHVWDDVALYDKLLSLRVPDAVKSILPLPHRSSIRTGTDR